MRLVLDKLEEYQPGNLKLRQFAGDLANTIKSSYENKIRPATTGGVSGAGLTGSTFFEQLGLTGIAEAYKKKSEAKEQRRQDKEKFVGDFQKYSEAGQNLSADTSRQIADSLFEEIASKREELKRLQEEEARIREAGYKVSEENLAKQKELVDAIKSLDPRTGDKPEGSADQNLNQIQNAEKEMETAEIASEHFEVQKKEQEDITALYTITDDHFKKMDKRTEEMLEALKVIAENGVGGGGGGGLLSSAADLLGGGRGGAGKTAGKVGKLAAMAGKLGTVAKVGGGLLAVGTAAYDAYGDYSEADRQVQAGEITKEQGQVKKGEAVGGGVGAAGGALAGAKAGAMLGAFGGPIGMAVGGLLGGAAGYIGGKWLGKKAGGGAVSGYQAVTGTAADTKPAEGSTSSSPTQQTVTEGTQSGITLEQIQARPEYKQEYEKLTRAGMAPQQAHKFAEAKARTAILKESKSVNAPMQVASAPPPSPEPVPPEQAGEIRLRRRGLQDAQAAAENTQVASNTNVNAPVTNVVNNTTKQQGPKDTKNNDSTFQKYMDRRYYPVA